MDIKAWRKWATKSGHSDQSLQKKGDGGSGEMAQWVRCLLWKCSNLPSCLEHPQEQVCVMVNICNPRAGMWREEAPRGLLASQPAPGLMRECVERNRERPLPVCVWSTASLHTYMCITHTHTHWNWNWCQGWSTAGVPYICFVSSSLHSAAKMCRALETRASWVQTRWNLNWVEGGKVFSAQA